jgi:outer membrane protein assembly factor BamB/tetratricopeptide (TPR) repeat protein
VFVTLKPLLMSLSKVVGHIVSVLRSLRNRHVENVPHVIAGFFAVCVLAHAAAALAADPPKKPMRESAAVPSDKNILKRFSAIEDYLAEKRWTEAIEVLQEIAQTDGRMLVLAEPGTAGKSAGYLNVATRCNILLSKLPPAGLQAYRKRVDPQARRWMEQWNRTHDEADLLRVHREAYLSSFGDEALWALGESAWDRGDAASARLYWTQLVPLGQEARAADLPTVLRYPDSKLNHAGVLARLVLCTLLEGERDRARTELERLKELVPGAEGSLAGRQGRLSDLLAEIIDESAAWEASADADGAATFALNAGRSGVLPAGVELGASRWSHPLPSPQLRFPERINAAPDRGPLSYHPVTFGDIVLVNSARSVWAWNLLTGEPAWPNERGTAEIYPPVPEEDGGPPSQVCSGVPYQTMTVADGRLYARLGAVTNPAEKEFRSESLECDLVCLDLANGQGKLAWKIAANELIRDEHTWRFEGSPLVQGGRAFVALSRRRPQFEFAIACLDAATGRLIWNRPVVFARGAADDLHNRVSHLLLTAGAGKLFLSTDAGAIVAVDAGDGRLDWAVTYESVPAPPAAASDHLRQGLLPAMFHEGLLFAAPNDCNRLFCIEADSGRVRWQIDQPKTGRWRHLLGVVSGGDSGRLIVSGNSLWSIDIASKNVVFGRRSNAFGDRIPPEDQGYGRGVLAGNTVLWPTRESVKVVDASTGMTISEKKLHTPEAADVGGNLTVAQGMLLVAQPERLVAYCEYSLIKQRLERELSERTGAAVPGNPLIASPTGPTRRTRRMSTEDLFGQLADVELAQGNVDAAVGALRNAVAARESDPLGAKTSPSKYRRELLELLRHAARSAVSEGKAAQAVERLLEARQQATDQADAAAILIDLAEAELANERPVAAVGYWQEILDDGRIRDEKYRVTTAGATASTAIASLIKERGPAVYVDIERRAATEVSEFLKTGDLSGLRRVLQKYPNAVATRRAWHDLAELDCRAGNFHSGLAIFARLLDQSSAPDERAACLADRASTLEAAGYWRTARMAWKQLASGNLAGEEIELAGSMHRAGDLARRRLENPHYKLYEPPEEPAARYLDRAWSLNLAEPTAPQIGQHIGPAALTPPVGHSTILVPQYESPAFGLACLLVHRLGSAADGAGPRLDCLDRATGKVRWSRSLAAAPQWSAYSESGLLLATGNQLTAVALEDGRELWVTPLITTTSAEVNASRPVIADGVVWRTADGVDSRTAERDDRPGKPAHPVHPVHPVHLALRDHWVLAFESQSGATAIDARTGNMAWTFKPPRGHLQGHWSCGARGIALQTLKPAIHWLIDISAERRVTELPGTAEPWLQGPVFDEDDVTLVAVNSHRRIECQSAETGHSRWDYQGGMSFAHVDPILWSAGGRLLLTVDGTTLTSVNPLTGRADWSVGIADRPLKNPGTQVVATRDAAFAASHGLLRRISLKYGGCNWEQFLGTTADQWRVADCGELIAAWPVETPNRGDSSVRSPQHIIWCDARTGRVIQQLTIGTDERVLDVTGDEHGCLVRTNKTLVAFRPAAEAREIASGKR